MDRYDTFEMNGFWYYTLGFVIQNSLILGMAVGIKLFKYWYASDLRIKRIAKEKLMAELQYLKNQINPHFLFNSLNNILVMHKTNHPETENSIIGLSDLLKYQLYDCSNESLPLKKEIEYIENFIHLEKIRKTDLDFKFSIISEENGIGKSIEPLLFSTFIENAFKHVRKNETAYFLYITLEIHPASIHFTVVNSKRKHYVSSKIGGIGIENVKKRLNLVYKDRYDLEISNLEEEYKTELTIFFKEINTN